MIHPRLVSWENGTDLVIELRLPATPATAWAALVDGSAAGAWFAPFRVEDDGAVSPDPIAAAEAPEDGAAEEAPIATVVFDLGETELEGEILSCEPEEHVLVELDDFGVLGLRLIGLETAEEAGAAPGTGAEPAGTVLVFTQTAADVESARRFAADHGPMWDTHLRLFAHTLGAEFAATDEATLTARYSALEVDEEAR
ncbi:hypothetical protein DFO66_101393 [Brevibacterium sanguinis]|uniref:Activator of Hsp90 ATPase-like protein n=2 Tax=Brevibacterium TaxID=1696 RepID=A0A366IMW9_9MICO|nr:MULTISPECIES: hypothetical protein [Brevibacterium]RBP68165.1 hypothetical protein DFO66_101393 [Brevibacterium sanguinis]RBP74418.1 hypothetical protein DFO65_101136 [Brevibacterium celere]